MAASKPQIAYLGLGTMGRGMVANLVAAGYSVTVWNRTPVDSKDLGVDVSVASTIAEAVSGADLVMYCLADDPAVRDVVQGAQGVAAHVSDDAIVVDLSTISFSAHVEEREAYEARGVRLVDAPVFGSRGEANAGGLWVVAGGDEADFARVREPLSVVAESVHYMGPSGSGVRMKLVGNYLVLAQLTALGTALSMANKAGLPVDAVLGVLKVTDFRSPIFDGVGDAVAKDDYAPDFAAKLALKDAKLLQEVGAELGLAVPVADTAQDLLERAVGEGWGDLNASALIKVIAADAGVNLAR
ncbi:NAD(P)-dependent oxidoreductase [Demequina sp. SO4-18]|uniref:NAD(P)-dependent oxidoreductase n=1 Tax=Demequina sp. SO4-18 TaxID=3401026 RepID=UPI003B5CA1BD